MSLWLGTLASPTSEIVKENLAMHFDAGISSSYPGSGTTWFDISGNSRNATIYGSPSYSTSNGGVFNLDGVNDYFDVTPINSPVITVATALYLEPYPVANSFKFYVIIRQGFSPINFSMYLDNYQYRPFLLGTGPGTWPSSGYFFGIQSWQYVVATFNWNNYTYKLYINGSLVVSSTFNSTDAGAYQFASGQQSNISRNVNNNNSFIFGKMGLFKIYTTELTQSQVTQNYNFYKPRFGF